MISGATVLLASAVASNVVRVDDVPNPPLMPAADVELPGVIVSRLLPNAVISELT